MSATLLKTKKGQKYVLFKVNERNYNLFLNNMFFTVNKNNQLTGYCTTPLHGVLNPQRLNNKFIKESGLTSKNFNKKFGEDTRILGIGLRNANYFKPIDLLEKPVRGSRLVTTTEKEKLNYKIVYELMDGEPITLNDRLYPTSKLEHIYSYCMEYDIIDGFFNYQNEKYKDLMN